MQQLTNAREKRLNPLALPAETNTLFFLLILISIIFGFSFGDMFQTIVYGPEPFEFINRTQNIITDSLIGINEALISLKYRLGGIVILLFTSILIYYFYPTFIKFTKKGKPLDPKDSRNIKIHNIIKDLSHKANITPPRIVIGEKLNQEAFVFGVYPWYTLHIGKGLRYLVNKPQKEEAFKAIILHELAHIANKDIGKAYFAQSIWTANLLLAIAILISSLFFDTEYVLGRPHATTQWLYYLIRPLA